MKLDLGCGDQCKEGFVGIDREAYPGVSRWDLTQTPWMTGEMFEVPDGSISEAHIGHLIEYLTGEERMRFFNELHRVLEPGAKALLVTFHWCSTRGYGDPMVQWPPVSEMFLMMLNRDVRQQNAKHLDRVLKCDFDITIGYGMNPALAVRNQEYQQFALSNYKEAATDLIATLTKK